MARPRVRKGVPTRMSDAGPEILDPKPYIGVPQEDDIPLVPVVDLNPQPVEEEEDGSPTPD